MALATDCYTVLAHPSGEEDADCVLRGLVLDAVRQVVPRVVGQQNVYVVQDGSVTLRRDGVGELLEVAGAVGADPLRQHEGLVVFGVDVAGHSGRVPEQRPQPVALPRAAHSGRADRRPRLGDVEVVVAAEQSEDAVRVVAGNGGGLLGLR